MDTQTGPSRDKDAADNLYELADRLSEIARLARDGGPIKLELSSPPNPSPQIAGDILHGADGIAAFLYGDARYRRKVYNLIETGRLPHFRLGAGLCARKSVLLAWIQAQEANEK